MMDPPDRPRLGADGALYPPWPPQPDRWPPARPGDHDWSGPDGACAACGVVFLDVAGPCPRRRCPDDGTCHHRCGPGACFRVHMCGPLSGVYPGDTWPPGITGAYRPGGVL